MFEVPEKYRNGGDFLKKSSPYWTDSSMGNNGVFYIPLRERTKRGMMLYHLKVLASDGEGWQHVSVSMPTRIPTWAEMCLVKKRFWGPNSAVMQLHPPESDYVNYHPFCLHLWRPVAGNIPLPPSWMVGPKAD